MRLGFTKLVVNLQCLTTQDEGQDIVEYVLLIALLATGTMVASGKLSAAITNIFVTVSNQLA